MYKKFIQRGTEVELQQKIAAMRKGGRILGNLLRDLKAYVRPGMTGKEVDAWVRRETVKRGGKVAYDYLEEDFPGAICISVNDEIVHGIPTDRLIWTYCMTGTIQMLGLRCWWVAKVHQR